MKKEFLEPLFDVVYFEDEAVLTQSLERVFGNDNADDKIVYPW